MIASGPGVLRPAPLNAVSDLTGVGSERFVERTREELGIRTKGRKLLESGEAFQLREPVACYSGISGIKNDNIGAKNGYFWNINLNI